MRGDFRPPLWLRAGAPPDFPDASEFEPQGLVAGGGDLSPARLLAAYGSGIFPWYDEPPILWWSPDPRAIIERDALHVSRSMRRRLRTTSMRVTCNIALERVMEGCAGRVEGTWITTDMKRAYLNLASSGHMLSYEVWEGSELVGGLYGVLLGGLFAAESKFHKKTDASKIALVSAVVDLFDRGLQLFDVQFVTDHLETMGAKEIPRLTYLERLKDARLARLISVGSPRIEPPPSGTAALDVLPRVRALLEIG